MRAKLTEVQLSAALETLPTWKVEQGELTRTITFPDFKSAMAFVNQIADLAEAANHHPDIDIRYNKVHLSLTTHDSGGLTQNDVDLATSIAALPTK